MKVGIILQLCLGRNTLPPEELERYEAQYKYIRQICALYEDDPNNFSQLFALIQEVCICSYLKLTFYTLAQLTLRNPILPFEY